MSRSPASPRFPKDPNRPGPLRSWQRRSSPLSRYALLAYLLIVVDASLFPFTGWRDLGLAPYDYLFAAWPARGLPFDLFVNALGYLPLGFVTVLALHPRWRGVGAILGAVVLCAVLSIHLEALQTYLPTRVASKVDVSANVGGGLLGAILAARFAHALLDTGRLRVWRTRWFASDASRGLVLILVWFPALIYPDAFVLGTGGLLKALDPAASARLAAAVGLVDQGDAVATAMRFQLAETAVMALTLFGAGLLFLNLMRPGLPWLKRLVLLLLFVAATVAIVAFARAFLFDGVGVWPLLTAGARSGLVMAAAGLVVATVLPPRLRWILGFASVIAALVVINVYPDNPYGGAVGAAWTRGKLLNFYGLASGLNLVWPYVALVYFLRHRGSEPRHGRKRETPVAKAGTVGSSL